MIELTRFQGKEFYLNSDLIEYIENNPDTVITLTNGKKIVVMEEPEEIVERIKAFRREINFPYIK
ncbi:MAG: flagellar protein FlbD [Clostridia bacterium]|jgi:flagellar protein FlbD|nr:flagellar protein FlbD [Clostridia bacterium]MDN5322937.1 flagellar protein FlbD [Clostridia bacterium]